MDTSNNNVILEEKNIGVHITLYFEGGCLSLDSIVYGDDEDFDFTSEAYYRLNYENTEKLLECIGGKENPVLRLKEIFEDNFSSAKFTEICDAHGVEYDVTVI